jgi:mono/diheme cytochrome c family protein
MSLRTLTVGLVLILNSSSTFGADAEVGKLLARSHCAGCHVVAPNGRPEIADAPPFEVIARKYAINQERLISSLVGPHAKMNFSPTRSEADDIAAYIGTLAN